MARGKAQTTLVDEDISEEQDAAQWERWLARFDLYILPVFVAHGYSRDAALTVYFTSRPEDDE